MKDKDLINKLKKLKETPVKRGFLTSLQNDLKKYMEFYPIREGIEVKAGEASPFFGMPILKTAAFVLIVMLVFGGGGAVFASQKSLPGDILYPVKIFGENLQETLTFNNQKKAYLHTDLAEKRIGEIKDILEKRGIEPKGLSVAEERLLMHVTSARQIMEKELAEGRNGEFLEKIANKLNNLETEQERLEEEIEAKEKAEEKNDDSDDLDDDDNDDDDKDDDSDGDDKDDDSDGENGD